MSVPFNSNDPHVIIVGKRVDGVWHYLASEPMTMRQAEQAVKEFGCSHDDKVAYARPSHDPEALALARPPA